MKESQSCLSGLLITFSERKMLLFSNLLICFSYPVTTFKINIFLLSFQGEKKHMQNISSVHCFLWFFLVLNLTGKSSISYHLVANGIIWNMVDFFFLLQIVDQYISKVALRNLGILKDFINLQVLNICFYLFP